ncbi:MAG: aldo/keto reductase [Caldilineaceae bacterium]
MGTWLKQRPRDELVIATKVRFPMSDGPNDVGLSRKHILSSVESSLRRLQTDYIDLYQVHSWDHRTPLEETLSTLDGLVKAGKVRYLGVSNYTGWQLQKAIDLSKARGWEPFASLQPLYNLLDRSTEWELVPVCQNEGLGIIPWSPLRGGWLTGTPPGDGGAAHRHAHREGRAPGVERIVARVRQRAHVEHHRHAAGHRRRDGQIRGPGRASTVLNRPGITAPIIGARTLEQLDDNLGAAGWALSDAQMARLTEVSEPELPYPYDTIRNQATRR